MCMPVHTPLLFHPSHGFNTTSKIIESENESESHPRATLSDPPFQRETRYDLHMRFAYILYVDVELYFYISILAGWMRCEVWCVVCVRLTDGCCQHHDEK